LAVFKLAASPVSIGQSTFSDKMFLRLRGPLLVIQTGVPAGRGGEGLMRGDALHPPSNSKILRVDPQLRRKKVVSPDIIQVLK
jgi:hypothetical protein